MSQLPCTRFWEGPVGIALKPRKQQSGEYFWTFAFTRAFKRQGKETWEYTDFFGQKHAVALGKVMSRAMQFMEQTSPAEFTEKWMAAKSSQESEQDEEAEQNELGGLNEIRLPPHNQVAA